MLLTLAQWLTGEFENSDQAIAQPAWFVSLRLWHRPLPTRIDGNLALFAEQANTLYLDQPYRQRILNLQETADPQILRVQYFAFKQPERFKGAGAHPQRLEGLTMEDLDLLPGCWLTVKQQSNCFIAQPEADARCFFQYNGETRQVVLGFEVSDRQFRSYDKGVNIETGEGLWGALMGPYEFKKCKDFSEKWV